jgi:hypothetical protein
MFGIHNNPNNPNNAVMLEITFGPSDVLITRSDVVVAGCGFIRGAGCAVD